MTMPNFKASGDINPSRFATISGAKTVAQSVAGEAPIGITQRGVKDTPLPGASTLAAAGGDVIQLYGPGETCPLEAGEAIAAGAFLKPDADAKGIAVVGGEAYYAQSLVAASAAGEKVDVYIVRGVSPEPVGTVAAAGSTQADAAALTANTLNVVSGADGTKGVKLPAAVAGLRCRVYSSVATNGLKVYPSSGDDINDGTADAAITIEGKTVATFIAVDGSTWTADFTANT